MEKLLGLNANDIITGLLFVVFLIMGIKEFLDYADFFNKRAKVKYDKERQLEQIQVGLEEIKENQRVAMYQNDERFKAIEKNINLLMKSDKEDFKAALIEKHKSCLESGRIDERSLEVLENKYRYYQQEGGNSFAEKLMNDIRCLPNNPTKED